MTNSKLIHCNIEYGWPTPSPLFHGMGQSSKSGAQVFDDFRQFGEQVACEHSGIAEG